MKLLGAIYAGGASVRFGMDKAQALYQGRTPLLAHMAGLIAAQTSDLVVLSSIPRDGYACLADMPRGGLGPLGGLCAALDRAQAEGFDAVLTAPVDMPDLPANLADLLVGELAGPASAVIAAGRKDGSGLRPVPVVGLWRAGLAPLLLEMLEARGSMSRGPALMAFADDVGACTVELPGDMLTNANRPDDLTSRPV